MWRFASPIMHRFAKCGRELAAPLDESRLGYNLRPFATTLAAMPDAPAHAVPQAVLDALTLADASWRPHLEAGLSAMMVADPAYLPALATDDYLPTEGRLFAAFSLPLQKVRYVLMGEGPYPRAESATGVCFMDGAVGELWSDTGLSKPVNRATSLRNFMKMLLVADGQLSEDDTGGAALAPVAKAARAGGAIATLAQLQDRLLGEGFLLLNASLVFRKHVAPVVDARAWLPFQRAVFAALGGCADKPTLILWGKIAEQLKNVPETEDLPQVQAEHPYNLSFIRHHGMQKLFGPMQLLHPR
jgi:uracil-DNA glycosylase